MKRPRGKQGRHRSVQELIANAVVENSRPAQFFLKKGDAAELSCTRSVLLFSKGRAKRLIDLCLNAENHQATSVSRDRENIGLRYGCSAGKLYTPFRERRQQFKLGERGIVG